MAPRDLDRQVAAAARAMQAVTSTLLTLEKCVTIAIELIDGCDYAGVSLVHGMGPIDTSAASDPLVERADELQYALNEGPCLNAIWDQETVLCPSLGEEERWPRWGPQVAEELGVVSLLSFQLYTNRETLGVLNLFSKRVNAFDEDDIHAGTLLAAHGAVALAESQNAEHLQTAGLNRTIIGQAEGILMERYSLTADQAFAVLRRISQNGNVKLYQVAVELISTRRIPGAAALG